MGSILKILIYWMVMYGFSIAALIHLGIAAEKPMYFIAGILLGSGTLTLSVMKSNGLGHLSQEKGLKR